jgi:Rrf2 family iron-sulfur cluster assembly transcriptional regulator
VEITRHTDYAIRMLVSLAGATEGRPVSARELARAQDVPYAFARGIVSDLVRAGFATGRRGTGGGVMLARPAAEITVLAVIESTEGDVSLGLCTHDTDYCHRTDGCAMHRVWMEAEARLRSFLATRTIADLVMNSPTPRPADPASPAGTGTAAAGR